MQIVCSLSCAGDFVRRALLLLSLFGAPLPRPSPPRATLTLFPFLLDFQAKFASRSTATRTSTSSFARTERSLFVAWEERSQARTSSSSSPSPLFDCPSSRLPCSLPTLLVGLSAELTLPSCCFAFPSPALRQLRPRPPRPLASTRRAPSSTTRRAPLHPLHTMSTRSPPPLPPLNTNPSLQIPHRPTPSPKSLRNSSRFLTNYEQTSEGSCRKSSSASERGPALRRG